MCPSTSANPAAKSASPPAKPAASFKRIMLSALEPFSPFCFDGELEAPRSLLPEVHRLYFEPQYPEFSARTMWSLSNAFTSAFKKLYPVPQFKATAKLGGFLSQLPN